MCSDSRGGPTPVTRECLRRVPGMTRGRASWQWWVRKKAFERAASAYVFGSAESVVDDPVVAKWFACGHGGLTARRAGGARVRAYRPSPGCGVSKRSRVAKTLCLYAPVHIAPAIECVLQERYNPSSDRVSRWGRIGELSLRALCLVAFCGVDACVASKEQAGEFRENHSWCVLPH